MKNGLVNFCLGIYPNHGNAWQPSMVTCMHKTKALPNHITDSESMGTINAQETTELFGYITASIAIVTL